MKEQVSQKAHVPTEEPCRTAGERSRLFLAHAKLMHIHLSEYTAERLVATLVNEVQRLRVSHLLQKQFRPMRIKLSMEKLLSHPLGAEGLDFYRFLLFEEITDLDEPDVVFWSWVGWVRKRGTHHFVSIMSFPDRACSVVAFFARILSASGPLSTITVSPACMHVNMQFRELRDEHTLYSTPSIVTLS